MVGSLGSVGSVGSVAVFPAEFAYGATKGTKKG
jgi:hypothetical protein